MRVLIVEDEDLAVWGLISKLRQIDAEIEIVATLSSVRETVAWFSVHPAPDLAFFDIQLSDGLSFEVFERVKVPCPIVFTTAYDAYALRAFKVNSIDYLLKPVSQEDLAQAIEKWRYLCPPAPQNDPALMQQVLHLLQAKPYKTRFMAKVGDHLSAVETEEIAFFFGENKIVWIRTHAGRKYPIDYTLEELEDMLDPQRFFRLNRQYIASIKAIKDAVAFSNSRLKVTLKDPINNDEILISREKADQFKLWLGK